MLNYLLRFKELNKQITPDGLVALGRLLQSSRLSLKDDRSGRSFGYRRLSSLIKERTGVSVGKDTLRELELAIIKQPTPDTLMAIAAAGYVCFPDGSPLSVDDLLKVASEQLTPELAPGTDE